MKLLLKFLSLGLISILCIVLLGYNSTSNLKQYSKFTKEIRYNSDLMHMYSERKIIVENINQVIWDAIEYSELKRQDKINVLTKQLQKYSDIYYEHSNNFPDETKVNFASYLSSAQQVVKSLGTNEFKDSIDQYEREFLNTKNENNLSYQQVEANNLKLVHQEEQILKEYFEEIIEVASVASVLTFLITLFSYTNIFNPLFTIIKTMTDDNTKPVPFSSRKDEIGELARAAEALRINSIEKTRIEEESKERVKQAEEERKKAMTSFAHNFETKVKDIADMVSSSIEKMNLTSKELEKLALETQHETSILSSTSLQTNSNIKEVSKATHEYKVSADDINSQISKSLEYSLKAGEQTDSINKVVLELEEKANAVSGIIDIINNITSQIDLLALNATIEAARAGDMGKGFAVVANEVKALATQTSKATEQINLQISAIQSSSGKAVASIQEITESVKTINKNSELITSAVKKQSSTSSLIANSIAEVVSKFDSVTSGVSRVADSSNQYSNAATQIVAATSDLAKQSSMLREEVDKFLSSLKLN